MKIRKQHLVVIRGLAVSAAVLAAASFALSTVIRDAASTTPPPPERVSNEPRTPATPATPATEGHADPLVIREAHSDGGYTYSLERQPAQRAAGLR
jgi:hypothetical protein